MDSHPQGDNLEDTRQVVTSLEANQVVTQLVTSLEDSREANQAATGPLLTAARATVLPPPVAQVTALRHNRATRSKTTRATKATPVTLTNASSHPHPEHTDNH